MNWLIPNTIFLTLHGSKAYGLANEFSDLDLKGIVIPPNHVENDLFHKFEQAENSREVAIEFAPMIEYHLNPSNPKIESTIFSLRKFMILAANVNPNIIELLYTDPFDHLLMLPPMFKLLENRDLFLSSKAKFTFAGYAYSQAAKIERHRKWIVLGELTPPTRESFGLPTIQPRQLDDVFGYIKGEVEKWNLSKFPMEEQQRSEFKETIWEMIYQLNGLKVGWDNWPDVYEAGLMQQLAEQYNLKDEVVSLLNKERLYKKAREQYQSWLNWKHTRNPERHKLEVTSGYDTKHASHLVRLMRMGYEILTEGKVNVKRADHEELLLIKNGGWTYEEVMTFAEDMQKELDEAYKTTTLRKSVDFEAVNNLYHELTNDFFTK